MEEWKMEVTSGYRYLKITVKSNHFKKDQHVLWMTFRTSLELRLNNKDFPFRNIRTKKTASEK
ncbi:hypothetical protein [Chryseobacterium vaccae]|uniref:hypothetical protein n=1 Tax=Chryseobacterium vaccae TaxID=2604424 RepID=UPI001297C627|nr:hypothetical protein [Chryseobacterium vaccae]